jgi:hypothetical protein
MPLKLAQAEAEAELPKSLKILNPATNRYVNIDSKIGRLVAWLLASFMLRQNPSMWPQSTCIS